MRINNGLGVNYVLDAKLLRLVVDGDQHSDANCWGLGELTER